MSKLDIKLNQRIKQIRLKYGYKSQQSFADALFVDRSLVKSWEREEKPVLPRLDNLLAMCDLFNCDLDYLIGRIEEPTHDIKTACELTGLSEEAVKRITAHKIPSQPGTKGYDIKTACELTGLSEEEIRAIVKPQMKRSLIAKYLSFLIESDRFAAFIMAYKRFIESADILKGSSLEAAQCNIKDTEKVVLNPDEATRYFMRDTADAMLFLCEEEYRKQYKVAMENQQQQIQEEIDKGDDIESGDE